MPPGGKVGVSAMCILGYNVNAGQEISLRLRTDDLRGFRRYDRIRETLCHELAHMVHSEHNANFKVSSCGPMRVRSTGKDIAKRLPRVSSNFLVVGTSSSLYQAFCRIHFQSPTNHAVQKCSLPVQDLQLEHGNAQSFAAAKAWGLSMMSSVSQQPWFPAKKQPNLIPASSVP